MGSKWCVWCRHQCCEERDSYSQAYHADTQNLLNLNHVIQYLVVPHVVICETVVSTIPAHFFCICERMFLVSLKLKSYFLTTDGVFKHHVCGLVCCDDDEGLSLEILPRVEAWSGCSEGQRVVCSRGFQSVINCGHKF